MGRYHGIRGIWTTKLRWDYSYKILSLFQHESKSNDRHRYLETTGRGRIELVYVTGGDHHCLPGEISGYHIARLVDRLEDLGIVSTNTDIRYSDWVFEYLPVGQFEAGHLDRNAGRGGKLVSDVNGRG